MSGPAAAQGMEGAKEREHGTMGQGMMKGSMECEHGKMGKGMMQDGMGPGMGRGTGALFGTRVTPVMNLSVEDVRGYLAMQVERLNNKRLKVGEVKADGATITADVVWTTRLCNASRSTGAPARSSTRTDRERDQPPVSRRSYRRRQTMRVSNPSLAATVAAVALVPTWASAQGPSAPERYAYGPHMMEWGGGWYGMIFGPLFMILVLAVVIAVAVLLVRWVGGPWHGTASQQGTPGRTPLDILKERFARGEIDKEEFEERRRMLGD